MQIISRKKFAKATWALNKKAFMISMAYIRFKILISLAWKAKSDLSLAKKIRVAKEYTDFFDIFFKKSTIAISNYLDINKHAINSKLGK